MEGNPILFPSVSDVVVADPAFYTPIKLSASSSLEGPLALWYQIHGENNTHYNLLTTECTSVNGLWTAVTIVVSMLTQITVSAISTEETCHNIHVDLGQCAVTIDEESPIPTNGNYSVTAQVYPKHPLEYELGHGTIYKHLTHFCCTESEIHVFASIFMHITGHFYNAFIDVKNYTGPLSLDPSYDHYTLLPFLNEPFLL